MITGHTYKAEMVDGSLIVRNAKGDKVKVTFAGTTDNRTLYAYVPEGYIGGWQWPHVPMPFKALVDSINRGIMYGSMSELPTGGGKGSKGPRRRTGL